MTGEVFIIEVHQAILIDHLHNNLLFPIHIRMYDIKVNDITKYLNENPTAQTHSIVMQEKWETLLIPLHLHGVTSYFTSRNPTMEEYNNCTQFSATTMDTECDPYDPYFSAQEDALLTTGGLLRKRPEELGGRFVSGMHTNTSKYIQEYGDRKLEHVLTARIILSSVGGQASTRIQPTDPTDLS